MESYLELRGNLVVFAQEWSKQVRLLILCNLPVSVCHLASPGTILFGFDDGVVTVEAKWSSRGPFPDVAPLQRR